MRTKQSFINEEKNLKKSEKNADKLVKKTYVKDFSPFNRVQEPEVEVFNPEELFGGESGQSESAIIKELFNPKNPKLKTDVSREEINIIARLYVMSQKYYEPLGIHSLKEALNQFVLLRISKDRKSREEFVRANQDIQKNKQNGLLEMFKGNNNNL